MEILAGSRKEEEEAVQPTGTIREVSRHGHTLSAEARDTSTPSHPCTEQRGDQSPTSESRPSIYCLLLFSLNLLSIPVFVPVKLKVCNGEICLNGRVQHGKNSEYSIIQRVFQYNGKISKLHKFPLTKASLKFTFLVF